MEPFYYAYHIKNKKTGVIDVRRVRSRFVNNNNTIPCCRITDVTSPTSLVNLVDLCNQNGIPVRG